MGHNCGSSRFSKVKATQPEQYFINRLRNITAATTAGRNYASANVTGTCSKNVGYVFFSHALLGHLGFFASKAEV